MSEANVVMATTPSLMEYRAEIIGLIESGNRLLDSVLANVQPRRREVSEIAIAELKGLNAQFKELFDELIEVRTEQLQIYLAEQPQVCSHCLRMLTQTEGQLATHIQVAAKAASWAGWPEDEFKTKMRGVLDCGDEIVFVGPGAATVRKVNGATVTVWRRES